MIVGFSGFYQTVFDLQALILIRLGGVYSMAKSAS